MYAFALSFMAAICLYIIYFVCKILDQRSNQLIQKQALAFYRNKQKGNK